MAHGSEPGVTTIVGSNGTRLCLDDNGITYRNFLSTHRISWDQVRWITDGNRGADGWILRIVLHNGPDIKPEAVLRRGAHPETLAAIRQAAERHAVPAVLTGTPAEQGPPTAAGLYIDPGGKLGLREWTGTEWSPFLHVDPASSGPEGENGPATVWSPLPEPEQQRQWDTAARRARQAEVWFPICIGVMAVGTAVMLAVLAYDLSQPKADLRWVGPALTFLGLFGTGPTQLTWSARKDLRKIRQAAERAAELAGSEDSTASPLEDRDDDPAAGAG
jgi:hypothetical protein